MDLKYRNFAETIKSETAENDDTKEIQPGTSPPTNSKHNPEIVYQQTEDLIINIIEIENHDKSLPNTKTTGNLEVKSPETKNLIIENSSSEPEKNILENSSKDGGDSSTANEKKNIVHSSASILNSDNETCNRNTPTVNDKYHTSTMFTSSSKDAENVEENSSDGQPTVEGEENCESTSNPSTAVVRFEMEGNEGEIIFEIQNDEDND